MATEFQSKTFRSGFSEWEHFDDLLKDIETIYKKVERNSQNLERLVEYVLQFIFASNRDDERKIKSKVIESKLIDEEEEFEAFSRVVGVFFEIFSEENNKGDNLDHLLEDFSNKLKIDKSELYIIRILLDKTKNKSSYYEKLKKRKKARVGILPYLEGFETSVELRGIFNKDFKFVYDYESFIKDVKLEETTKPIISVLISLDSGTPDEFYFQATAEHINLLINELKAAVYKSELLQKRFNIK